MARIAGPIDAWEILKALGIEPSRKVRSAKISMGIDEIVTVTTEEYLQLPSDDLEQLKTVMRRYELVEKSDG